MNHSIGLKLKELREKHKLSRSKVAVVIDRNRGTYRSYESGESEPKVSDITKLCELYGLTPNELLGWDDAFNPWEHIL